MYWLRPLWQCQASFCLLFLAVLRSIHAANVMPCCLVRLWRSTGCPDEANAQMQSSVEHAKAQKLCAKGDCIVALHRIGNASVIKIVDIK